MNRVHTIPLIAAIYLSCLIYCVMTRPNPDERGNKFQGDIVLGRRKLAQEQVSSQLTQSAGIVGRKYRWPDKQIPYKISEDYDKDDVKMIKNAMKEIEDKTCIRFIPHNGEEDYIRIVDGEYCESNIGKVGGEQNLSLSTDGCLHHGTIVHELIHAIGFDHEQSRSDRGPYVTIMWGNIEVGNEINFEKLESDSSHDLPYDYSSIMHYSDDAFQKDEDSKTMIPSRNGVTLGQRHHMSAIDQEKINRMYQCHAKQSLITALKHIKNQGRVSQKPSV